MLKTCETHAIRTGDAIPSRGLTPPDNFDALRGLVSLVFFFSIRLPPNDAYRTWTSAGVKNSHPRPVPIISDFTEHEITPAMAIEHSLDMCGCDTCGFAVVQSRERDRRRFDDCIQWPECLTHPFTERVSRKI